MSLAPGAENPSAAYLAGAQHGAQLARQHASKPAAGKPPTVAAKTAKPSAPGGGSTLNDLLARAQAIARQETASQVAAIKGQQSSYMQQALEQARQIQAASQAGAQLIAGLDLGGQTANSYNTAAQNIAGLAQGFSGQTQADATSAADQVQQQLAQLGAPAGSAKTSTGQTSDPAALGNVLYGLGGFIPGNVLETTGQAQAGAQRTLPASELAYGNQMAAGTVAAGKTNADALTQNLLNAASQEPGLYQSILSTLGSQMTNQALAQSLIAGRSVSSQVAQQNAATRATQVANTGSYQQGRLAATKAASAAKAAAAKKPKPLPFNEKKDATSLAFGIAQGAFEGKDGKGKPAPKLTAPQAWDEMRKEGLLTNPHTQAIAAQAIIRTYGPGSNFLGGPGLSGKQKKLLDKVLPLPFGG